MLPGGGRSTPGSLDLSAGLAVDASAGLGATLPGGGRSTPVSLDLPEGLAFNAWAGLGERLAAVERSAAWWLGDWWAYGEHRYGDRKALVDRLRASGRDFPSFEVCRNYGSVARAVEAS